MDIREIVITDALKAQLRHIDRIKEHIINGPRIPEQELQRMEQEFVADHVHHAASLHSHLKTIGLD